MKARVMFTPEKTRLMMGTNSGKELREFEKDTFSSDTNKDLFYFLEIYVVRIIL